MYLICSFWKNDTVKFSMQNSFEKLFLTLKIKAALFSSEIRAD
jgi:hypothetical protein